MKKKTIEIMAYRIAKILKEKGWNQSDLARHLNVKPQAIQNWLRMKSTPKPENLDKLSQLTGYPISWFFEVEQEAKVEVEPLYALNEKERILLELFQSLPTTEREQLIAALHEKKQYYDNLLEELIDVRNQKMINAKKP